MDVAGVAFDGNAVLANVSIAATTKSSYSETGLQGRQTVTAANRED